MGKTLAFLLLAASLTVLAADSVTPTARVKAATDEILALVKDQELESEVRWARIADIIDNSFDFQSMSQSVLATNWKKATLSEREKFVEYFSDHLLKTYRNMIESYKGQEIRYVGEEIKGNRAVVQTVIQLEQTEAPVNYKLRKNGGTWYAYDVEIEGASLISKYRTEYGVIAKNQGMQGLLEHVRASLPTSTAVDEQEQGGD